MQPLLMSHFPPVHVKTKQRKLTLFLIPPSPRLITAQLEANIDMETGAGHQPISSSSFMSGFDVVSEAEHRGLLASAPTGAATGLRRGIILAEVNPLLVVPSHDSDDDEEQGRISYGTTAGTYRPNIIHHSSSDKTQDSSRRWLPTPHVAAAGASGGRSLAASAHPSREALQADNGPVSDQELLLTPIASRSSKGGGGAGNESFHSTYTTSIAGGRAADDGAPSYAVITFDLKTRCPTGEEFVVVSRVKSQIRNVAPRCRLQAFKERISYDNEELFDGVVQVVPMYSMLQVSLEHLVDHPTLQRVAASPRFWIFGVSVNLLLFLLLLVQESVPSQQQLGDPLSLLICVVAFLVLLVQTTYLLSCSRQLLMLVLRCFDFWMLQFWIIVTIVCNVKYTTIRYPDATRAMGLCEGLGLLLSLEATLILDAFPPLPRKWKGALYMILAGFNLYRYIHWFVSVRVDEATAAASIDFGSFELHLATAGQSAGAALVAYYSRLGVRALWRKLDLQLVDFPVNMVPHLDEEAARRAKRARQKRNAAAVGAPSKPNLHGAHEDDDQPGTLVNDSVVIATPRPHKSQQGSKYLKKESSMQWANSERVWLHVQGSLPCRHEHVSGTCRRLQETVATIGGKISFAVVDDGNNAFDCDRRTFEPHCFMLSFSPKPLVPFPIVFRGLSTKNWVNMSMSCVVLGSIVMFLINVFDSNNFILMSAVQSYLFSIAVIELLCGVSIDMVKHALFTLDFWYVLVVFASQIFSGVVIYSSSYNIALAVLHTAMVFSTCLFISTMDCIVLTQFNGRVKGIIGTTLALYCLVDAAWVTPTAVNAKPGIYNKSLNLYISMLSPGSIAILANVACFLVFCRVAGRTLWMGSRLVFMQFGAKEEILHESDAALMTSGGFSAVQTSFVNPNSPRPKQQGTDGDSSNNNPHSSSNFAASRVAFFGGYLGDDNGAQNSSAHWRTALRSKNARFVKVGKKGERRKGEVAAAAGPSSFNNNALTPDDDHRPGGSAEDFEDYTESDSSAVRFV
ncbi:transmembrane protein, putative [Bodo saltans]|uniref:Transmembrane protein, putative n=1 Tax=Bodo saltans TaxID=75058 RepID=A0A0S4JLC8_BODSA|nr:transmembrane protein, putative [Bodo saltans]|eukprot:CUG92313.1 transmembrane protein, putative [Bodo saltans]